MKLYAAILLAFLILPTVSFAQDASFRSTLKDARQGDRNSQNEVAVMYSEGVGVKPNQKKAVYWFRKSAEQGYAYGACNLGLHYGNGLGVARNRTLLMQWVFVAHNLDGLRCHPSDYIEMFKPTECQIEQGWKRAVAWLKMHPELKNVFDDRPWMEDDGKYPVTVREGTPSIQLPVRGKKKCR